MSDYTTLSIFFLSEMRRYFVLVCAILYLLCVFKAAQCDDDSVHNSQYGYKLAGDYARVVYHKKNISQSIQQQQQQQRHLEVDTSEEWMRREDDQRRFHTGQHAHCNVPL